MGGLDQYIDKRAPALPQIAEVSAAAFFQKLRSDHSHQDRWRLIMRVARKMTQKVSMHTFFQDDRIIELFEEHPKALYIGMDRTETPMRASCAEEEVNRFSAEDLRFFLTEYLMAEIEHVAKQAIDFRLHVRFRPDGYELVDVEIGVEFEEIEDPLPGEDMVPERLIYEEEHNLDTSQQPFSM